MNIHPHDNQPNRLLSSRSGASWSVVLLMLFSWLSSPTNVHAGCFLGDDYRIFHHGMLAPSSYPTTVDKLPSFSYQTRTWVYENGTFEPIKNPLPPRCDGPGCRSNPLEGHWGQPNTLVDSHRVFPVDSDSPTISVARTASSAVLSLGQDSPRVGESLLIDRPPKVSKVP